MDWSEIGKYVGILAAAIGGAGLVLKFSSSRSSKSKKIPALLFKKIIPLVAILLAATARKL